MALEEPFDLGIFLPNSLNLRAVVMPNCRRIFPQEDRDPYEHIKNMSPLDILGETKFGEPKIVSKDTVGTPIQAFFTGKTILITGATGFVGKILIDKLIRSVPHLEQIYLIVRAKRGKSAKERFDQLMDDMVFRRMRTEVPWYLSKITAVERDISQPDLGLSAVDRRLLTDKVHVVFHSAADVKFTEPLKVAIEANVLGSQRVLNLAKKMKQLKSYVHVSTAFSNCVQRDIFERVPTMTISYQEVLQFIKERSDQEVEEESTRLLQGWPNTYTFSKALAERLLEEESAGLPCCIVRPSVVMPTYKEPVRGYTDNLYGPVGMLLGAGHGILHCTRLPHELHMDQVPVDYTVNCLIAAAWATGTSTNHRFSESLTVFNYASTAWNPIMNWKHLIQFALDIKKSWPFGRSIWYTSFFCTDSYLINEMCFYLLHAWPAIVIDKLAELRGEKFRLSKIYNTIKTMKHQARYFSVRVWVFHNENVAALWRNMDEEDKNIFNFDTRDLDGKEFFLVCKLGIRYYYLKETMEGIPAAQRKNKWLFWIHNSVKVACGLAALKLMVLLAKVVPL